MNKNKSVRFNPMIVRHHLKIVRPSEDRQRGVVHSKIRQARKANRIKRKAKREKERKRKSDLGGPPSCKG